MCVSIDPPTLFFKWVRTAIDWPAEGSTTSGCLRLSVLSLVGEGRVRYSRRMISMTQG